MEHISITNMKTQMCGYFGFQGIGRESNSTPDPLSAQDLPNNVYDNYQDKISI